jgi:phenylacetate-coenzyme A ligase PaaK-like adenylate-forming protein
LQYDQNEIYRSYVDALGIDISGVKRIENIPFLPIAFFKSHKIATTDFEPAIIFESSGTTGKNTSSHFVKDLSVYKRSFLKAFRLFYGDPANWCVIALLPGYLERQHSSLVYMTDELIKMSNHPYSGFYLDDFDKLYQSIVHNEIRVQPALLIGVTFALMDFAEKYSLQLKHTTVMETGGMKGRRSEIIREEVHNFLKNKLGVQHIHSEYGMTESLSQAYSRKKGIFQCPPWMKVVVRE